VHFDFRRWGVFNLVGCAGFVVQLGAIALLTRGFGWSPVAATALGLELAAVQNFIGHSRWTWRHAPVSSVRGWALRYWRYQIAKAASLSANLVITTGLTYVQLPPEAASTAAVLLCALPNYFMSDRFVFQHHPVYTSRPCSRGETF
jgi:putative flippase GtrA